MTAVGIVAGNGRLPALVAEAARAAGRRVIMVAHEGETDPAVADLVDEIEWVKLGQLGKIRDTFTGAGVRDICLAGGVTKVRFFRDARPDALALKVFAAVATSRGDDRLLRAIAGTFEDAGLRIVPATDIAPDLLAEEGQIAGRKPNKEQRSDIALGFEVLRELGRLDIGQAVVVKEGVVLAVEATEGTDACVRRGCAEGMGSVVVVKAAKPDQDLRFDMPAIGPGTVEVLAAGGGGVIAVEAGRTLILDRGELKQLAGEHKIGVVGVRT